MAVLGRIRRRGTILIIIVGFGLFAFIAEEAFRSCETTKNNQRQQIGEVLGEKVNAQDFQKEVEDFTDYLKVAQGIDNLNDQQLQSVRDQVWGQFVQNKIIEREASKLGLKVTDEEMQNVLRAGTHPMLQRTPFTNQQTGRFDANALQKFLAEYKQNGTNPQYGEQYQMIYKYLPFTYCMNAMRECVGGLYQNDYWMDLSALGVYVLISLFVGLIVAIPLRRLNKVIERSKEKSKVML